MQRILDQKMNAHFLLCRVFFVFLFHFYFCSVFVLSVFCLALFFIQFYVERWQWEKLYVRCFYFFTFYFIFRRCSIWRCCAKVKKKLNKYILVCMLYIVMYYRQKLNNDIQVLLGIGKKWKPVRLRWSYNKHICHST